MFPGLRHHPFISGDNQQGQVNTTNPGQHILDEVLVARDVNNAYFPSAGQLEPGKTEVDSHASLFLFTKSVGVYPG